VPELLERAQARAGPGAVPGTGPAPEGLDNLQRLLDSCRETAGLTPAGTAVLEKVAVRHLVNGLRLAAAAVPGGVPDVAVVVTGLPRTGTTLVQQLLALDPAWRVLRLWEALSPVPAAGEGRSRPARIAAAETWVARYLEMAPEMRAIHSPSAEGPEECDALMQNHFASQHLDDMFDARRYSAWLYSADLSAEYGGHARQLRALEAGGPGEVRPWVLKSPSHLAHLGALLRTYPAAVVVQCHRAPVEAVASWASLVRAVRRPHTGTVVPAAVGEQCLERSARATERALAAREEAGEERFVDLAYRSLVADPLAAVRSVYDRTGRALPAGVEARMAAWVTGNPQHKHGRHHYRPADFGLAEEGVDRALGPYRRRFAPYLR